MKTCLLLLFIPTVVFAVPDVEMTEVIFQGLQEAKWECDSPVDQSIFDQGCSQRLTRCDQLHNGQNWTSRDWPFAGGGAYLDQVEVCDMPSTHSARGTFRVRFTNQGTFWTVIKQVVDPGYNIVCFDPPDPLAVLPDPAAESYHFGEGRCDKTDDQGVYVRTIGGPFARQFVIGAFPSSQDLYAFASLDFWLLPNYWDAYQSVVDGFVDIRHFASNPHAPDSPESQLESWQKRHAIAGLMAIGSAAAPRPEDPTWKAAEMVCEYVIRRYILNDSDWLLSMGWPTSETPAMTAAMNQWYLGTDQDHDPWVMFSDTDVAYEDTTWGKMKASYLEN